MNKICYGCGAKTQTSDKNKIGYIPENKKDDAVYCMRCYKLIHYGVEINDKEPKKIDEILYLVNHDDKHTIFMCDLLSLSDRVMNIYNKIKGKKLLLISKIDVISKDVKLDKVKKFIQDKYKIDNVKFVSSFNNYGVVSLIKYLDNNNIRSTYILGMTNSGKSTLINKIIDVCDVKINKTTISNKQNTTLDFIRLNINDLFTLIDSPGFVVEGYNNNLTLNKIVKPITYQIKDGDTLKVNNLFINFSNKTNVTIYSNYVLNCKKYYKDDLSFNKEYVIEDNQDIVIYGIGFVNVKNACKIKISTDEDIIEIRESVFR